MDLAELLIAARDGAYEGDLTDFLIDLSAHGTITNVQVDHGLPTTSVVHSSSEEGSAAGTTIWIDANDIFPRRMR
jgi:hypothetical protein